MGTWWHLYSLLPVSLSEGLTFFRKVISESLLQKDGAVWGERCFQGYWTIVAEGGAYCVQSVEAKDAATAKHPPNAYLGRESSGSSPRCQVCWDWGMPGELSWSSILYIQRRIHGLITKSKENVCSENRMGEWKRHGIFTALTNGMHGQSFLKDASKTKPYSQIISILYLFKENITTSTNR